MTNKLLVNIPRDRREEMMTVVVVVSNYHYYSDNCVLYTREGGREG